MNTLRRRNNSDSEFRSVPADHLKFHTTNKIQYLETDMACRDRTVEFKSVVKNKEGRLKEKYVPVRGKRHIKNLEQWTHFMQTANQIGRDLASTYAKLEKLTVLAKRRSLFADKPVEIEELTYVIKQDINSLNKQIAQLQESKARNNSHGKHMLHHSNSIVVSLQCKLANMSSNFREVLEVRTENLKHEKSRRDKFSGSNGTTTGTLPSAISGQTRSVLLSDESVSSHSHQNDECAINIDNQYQQQLQLIDEQDAYIQNRADTMQNIEATIVELGTIFQQLAHMVKEQEEIVQRIDANVEQSEMNIEAAHSEILKYFQNVTSNRWLMIKVFAVLIVFFIIFVVFVA
ncbi:syntaxin-5-like [Argiope bruennichi]|uniref:syntaxin-5-like n=1 Tax=Argiope bruennichi TaxID=94029 RepID=UPI0024940FA1|nr:syntaxin-5-like [Argiope bruennichi]XP_055927497.1 syntaxin-5-like [Argiope bruennichi]